MGPESPEDFGVDGVIVINLDHRPERWKSFQAAWRNLLPWERVVRLAATEGVCLPGYGASPWFRGRKRDRTWAGRAGCALSHAQALMEARRRGWSRVLIFEDDAAPTAATTRASLAGVLSRRDWDMLYLGCHEPQGSPDTVIEPLVRITGALDAHAYGVSARLRDWLIDQLPSEDSVWRWIARERALDRWYSRAVGRRFVVMMCAPELAMQSEGPSDITLTWRAADHSIARITGRAGTTGVTAHLSRVGRAMTDITRATWKSRFGF